MSLTVKTLPSAGPQPYPITGSLNRALFEGGTFAMRDDPQGHRRGRRNKEDKIVEAYGFDLSPLAQRTEEFKQTAARATGERDRMKPGKTAYHLHAPCVAAHQRAANTAQHPIATNRLIGACCHVRHGAASGNTYAITPKAATRAASEQIVESGETQQSDNSGRFASPVYGQCRCAPSDRGFGNEGDDRPGGLVHIRLILSRVLSNLQTKLEERNA